jgi:hypothetical protein
LWGERGGNIEAARDNPRGDPGRRDDGGHRGGLAKRGHEAKRGDRRCTGEESQGPPLHHDERGSGGSDGHAAAAADTDTDTAGRYACGGSRLNRGRGHRGDTERREEAALGPILGLVAVRRTKKPSLELVGSSIDEAVVLLHDSSPSR